MDFLFRNNSFSTRRIYMATIGVVLARVLMSALVFAFIL
jgi:hypothetical protein